MNATKIKRAFGEWIDYVKSDRSTWTPPNEEIFVLLRTPYKNPDGSPFFYMTKAVRVAPTRMRNLAIPEGRRGDYFDICLVVRWKNADPYPRR